MLAIEQLKSNGVDLPDPADLARLIRLSHDEKHFDLDVLSRLAKANKFGSLFGRLCLHLHSKEIFLILDYVATRALNKNFEVTSKYRYTGLKNQNYNIDWALARSAYERRTTHTFFGHGAAGEFNVPGLFDLIASIHPQIRHTPIAIIGGGAAGLMINHVLYRLGFERVTVFEHNSLLGIWSMPNVYNRSRNNPRDLKFSSLTLNAAPGNGREVRKFLTGMTIGVARSSNTISSVVPKSLAHILHTTDNQKLTYPIVINCAGVGTPRHPNSSSHMTTVTQMTYAGKRWQDEITPAFHNKNIVFVGLGNSTMEMLVQIQKSDLDIDYKVLTHMPGLAVQNPEETILKGGKQFRVFRDLSLPNLTRLAGDLPDVKNAYFKALRENRIISDVWKWQNDRSTVKVFTDKTLLDLPYNDLYCLIGYKHRNLKQFGINVDSANDPVYDYDGEFRKKHGGPFRGYFGFGSILKTDTNRNADVIPGNIFRIGDLLYSIILRAGEYWQKKDQHDRRTA